MKPIVAQEQVNLGPARCVQLAVSGMSYRMFRSSVTMAILALAVAFLVHMLVYGLMSHETHVSAYNELRESRNLGQVLTRLTQADAASEIVHRLAGTDPHVLGEYRRWAGVGLSEFEAAQQAAATVLELQRYFDSLPVSARTAMVGDQPVPEFLERLRQPAEFEAFAQKLQSFAVPVPLNDIEAFRAFVTEQRPQMREQVGRIRQSHREAVAALRVRYGDAAPRELAANPPADFAQALQEVGFSIGADQLPGLEQYARRVNDIQVLQRLVTDREVRRAVARETDVQPQDVTFMHVMELATASDEARWLAETMAAAGAPAHLTGERIEELAQIYTRERRLEDAGGGVAPVEVGGLFGLPVRTQVLIGLSFLVCVVGVANAMLMSVTERFTEIATMKCLGAMDKFVMMMFVFEAAIQGVVGGVIGIALGVILAMLRGGVEYGSLILTATSATGQILLALLLAIGVGIVLATVAAVGPSWVAARLAPMEAMRVE